MKTLVLIATLLTSMSTTQAVADSGDVWYPKCYFNPVTCF